MEQEQRLIELCKYIKMDINANTTTTPPTTGTGPATPTVTPISLPSDRRLKKNIIKIGESEVWIKYI